MMSTTGSENELNERSSQPFVAPCAFAIFSLFLSRPLASLLASNGENPNKETNVNEFFSYFFTFTWGIISLGFLLSIYKNPTSNAPCVIRRSNNMSIKNKRRVSAGVGLAWLLPFLLSCFGLIMVSKGLEEVIYKHSPSSLAPFEEYENFQNKKIPWIQGIIYTISWILHSSIHLQRHAKDMIKTVKEIKNLCCRTSSHSSASPEEENIQDTEQGIVNNSELSASSSTINNLSNSIDTLPTYEEALNNSEEVLTHSPTGSIISNLSNNITTLPSYAEALDIIAAEMTTHNSSRSNI